MGKVFKKDGSFYYYYYKKKRGRKKKRGPKRRIVSNDRRRTIERWNFKIVRCDARRQVEYIGTYDTLDEVEEKKKAISEENASVRIPVMFVNNRRNDRKPYEFLCEYLVLKRNRDGAKMTSMLRNEYGRLVENETTSDVWYIYDKFPCLVEERFWVYGRNPKRDRLTVTEFEELYITDKLMSSDANIMVTLYNNKLVLTHDDGGLSMLIAKNIQDGVRVYNCLDEKFGKSKRVFFVGFADGRGEKGKRLIALIEKKTGWDRKKIYKKTTVY